MDSSLQRASYDLQVKYFCCYFFLYILIINQRKNPDPDTALKILVRIQPFRKSTSDLKHYVHEIFHLMFSFIKIIEDIWAPGRFRPVLAWSGVKFKRKGF